MTSPIIRFLTFLILFNATVTSSAIAQESTSEEDVLVQDTIIVEYKFPGPPLWRVTNGENELLIFGVIDPLPTSFDWDPVRLERAVERADLYLSAPRSHFKIRNPIRVVRALRQLKRMKMNPDGRRLEEILPADIYARYAVIRDIYLEDSEEIDRLTPLFAADEIYREALHKAGLQGNWEIYEKADQIARRSRVERKRIRVKEKRDPLTFVNDMRSVPMEEQIECLSATLSLLEDHIPSLFTRAELWADGDVAPLATSAHPKLFVRACEATLQSGEQFSRITQLLNAKWLNTANEALETHKTTVAILDIAEIIEPDGLVSGLLERGFVIEGPVRSSTSDVGEGPYLGQTPPGSVRHQMI